jgi:DNA-binding Lrp family transcriptional regulator
MDVAVLLSASDMDSLNRRIDEIRNLPAVKKTKTSIVLKKWR